jgi:hypothetical protein
MNTEICPTLGFSILKMSPQISEPGFGAFGIGTTVYCTEHIKNIKIYFSYLAAPVLNLEKVYGSL